MVLGGIDGAGGAGAERASNVFVSGGVAMGLPEKNAKPEVRKLGRLKRCGSDRPLDLCIVTERGEELGIGCGRIA